MQFSESQIRHWFKTPVVGVSDSNESTSSNVHLYADPSTFITETPLLYADCEGLDGDERGIEMTEALGDPLLHASQDINWGGNPENGGVWTRREVTKTLFPRMLYIFSDVVVFIQFNRR